MDLSYLSELVYKLLYTIPAVLLALSFHEFCHGYTSYKLGDPTAKYHGRLTLNPLSHLDPVGTLMIIISSLSGFGFGWAKPVPVNPGYYRDAKKGMRITALAGPLSNFVFAIVSWWLYLIVMFVVIRFDLSQFDVLSKIFEFISGFLLTLLYVNIGLGCFNLLPVPPLDGWKIFGSFLPSDTYWKVMSYEDKIGMLFLLIVIVKSEILTTVLDPLFNIALQSVELFGKPIEMLINLFI